MKRACLVSWLVVSVATGEAVAFAGSSPGDPARAASATSLSDAIDREAHRLISGEGRLPSQARKRSQVQTRARLARCDSRKKGTLVGAAIGAVGGGALGIYVANRASGVPGAAQGGPKVIGYFTVAGAGAGALGGLSYCS